VILKDILDRAFEILGDVKDAPRFFVYADLVDLANRACLTFRANCHDEWHRVDVAGVAATGEYTIPDEILELRRVAYNDETLEARTVTNLQARDPKWQTRTGPDPMVWTSLGFAHDKFWVWPIPSQSSTETVTVSDDYGVIVRAIDSGGTAYTMTQEYGVTVLVDGITVSGDYGEIFETVASENKQFTLWGTKRPATMTSEDAEIPIRKPWQIACLWFILWQTYEQEGDHYNSVLSAWYRDQYLIQVESCKLQASNPVPAQVRALRGAGEMEAAPDEEGRYGQVTIGGVPTTVMWPRGGW
jgi:hypothetical protein